MFLCSVFLIVLPLVVGCSGINPPYPTLIPTAVIDADNTPIATASPDTPTDTANTATPVVTITLPTIQIASYTLPGFGVTPTRVVQSTAPADMGTPAFIVTQIAVAPTLPPVRASVADGAASITITAAQLNQAVKQAWRPEMAMDTPPIVSLRDGLIVVEMRIKMQLITLQLTLTTVSTTKGTMLDVRAVSVNTTNGVTTTQIKQGHALVQTMLEWLIYQAGVQQGLNVETLRYGGVTVGTNAITITLLTE